MPPKWVIALPQGGITTSQLNVLRQKYPGMIRKGRINVEKGQDATWKELVIHGDPDFMKPIWDECLRVISENRKEGAAMEKGAREQLLAQQKIRLELKRICAR